MVDIRTCYNTDTTIDQLATGPKECPYPCVSHSGRSLQLGLDLPAAIDEVGAHVLDGITPVDQEAVKDATSTRAHVLWKKQRE